MVVCRIAELALMSSDRCSFGDKFWILNDVDNLFALCALVHFLRRYLPKCGAIIIKVFACNSQVEKCKYIKSEKSAG